jgi:hypothetical protein
MFFFMDFGTMRRLGAREFKHHLAGTAPAANGPNAGGLPLESKIQTGFDFWSEMLTISYSTLDNAGADDGVNRLFVQFVDGANQLGMSNVEIDAVTIAAPGRQRAIGIAGNAGQSLNIPGVPYPHLWEGTGSIIANVRNTSNTANTIAITFGGYLIPAASRAAFDQWLLSLANMGYPAGYR